MIRPGAFRRRGFFCKQEAVVCVEIFLLLFGCAEIMRKCKIMDGHSQKNVVK